MAIQNPTYLSAKLTETLGLYRKAKEWIILSENLTGNSTIACLNEMRNSFDHLMRSLDEQDGVEKDRIDREFDSAKRHLHRALFDAFEVIVIHNLDKIQKELRDFSPQAISTAFPAYYQDISIQISKIQKRFGEARANKYSIVKGDYDFEIYEKDTESLLEMADKVSAAIPEINRVHKHLQKSSTRTTVEGIIIGILVTLVGGILLIYATPFFQQKDTQATPESQQPAPPQKTVAPKESIPPQDSL